MSKRCIKLIAILLFLILIITGCSSGNKTPEYWPTDEWRETSPEHMGMDFRDSHAYKWENLKKLHQTENWADFILNLPVKYSPGTHYEYSNITSFLLSAVIQKTTGMKTAEFAEKYLFSKLGIKHYIWLEHTSGVNFGNGTIRMNNLDLARFGYLYLKNGKWENEQVISRQWIEESTSPHVNNVENGYDYGYQWWIETADLFSAQGMGGQFIIVDRKNNLVVVFTASFTDRLGGESKNLYSNYIVPSILSDKILRQKSVSSITCLFWMRPYLN